jgi:hypothetical protein
MTRQKLAAWAKWLWMKSPALAVARQDASSGARTLIQIVYTWSGHWIEAGLHRPNPCETLRW